MPRSRHVRNLAGMTFDVPTASADGSAVDARVRGAIVVVGVALTPLAAKTPWASSPRWLIVVAGLGASASLWWLARRPWSVCLIGAAGYAVSGNFWPLAIGLFACGATRRPRHALSALLIGAAGIALHERLDDAAVTASTVESAIALAAVMVAVGLYAGTQRALLASFRQQAMLAASERSLRDGQARAEERARIAREMHDVVAHQITLIALQAGALEVNTTFDDASIVRTAGLIRRTARHALTELRDVLEPLAPESETKDRRRPDQTVHDVVQTCMDAGADVTIDGDSAGLPRAVERAAVRVAQEAITNAIRHAPGAPIHVKLSRSADGDAVMTIDNGPPADRTTPTNGSGRGLIGLAERLRLLGGSLRSGPGIDGGWQVEAHIPVKLTATDEPVGEPA
jgi:signal transduction histidine kinase